MFLKLGKVAKNQVKILIISGVIEKKPEGEMKISPAV